MQTKWAYYNEHDAYAAQWLRNLIAAGHIAPGEVDERSVEDVQPDDIRGFRQVHLFAGIGIWSHSLRAIGWDDDRGIWSASFPCQPFSAAGKGLGVDDERHLWPSGFHLITQCRPERIVGEQVASPDGLAWLDTVQSDMEAAAYAFGAVDICAAGVGAPHIRQRTYWMAHANNDGCDQRRECLPSTGNDGFIGDRPHVRMDDAIRTGLEGHGGRHSAEAGQRQGSVRPAAEAGEFSGVADAYQLDGHGERFGASDDGGQLVGTKGLRDVPDFIGVANTCGKRPDGRGTSETSVRPGSSWEQFERFRNANGKHPGPTNGRWADADWLFCRDGKWRPVEPGTFPLAHGAPSRVGRLRAYGNGLCVDQATYFLRAALT